MEGCLVVYDNVMIQTDEQPMWFAMRATYRRELIAQRALEAASIVSFVPMRYELKMERGRRRRRLVPAIHNLIFVQATPSVLQAVKAKMPYLQYMMRRVEGQAQGEKIVVPDAQMEAFMAAAASLDEGMTYLGPQEVSLEKGLHVRIHGGPCDGREGYLVKVPGYRNRRVVVAIEGVVAVALAEVKPEQIEVLS